jgi:hypothetical protein
MRRLLVPACLVCVALACWLDQRHQEDAATVAAAIAYALASLSERRTTP